MARDEALRKHLTKLIDWEDAPVGLEAVVEGLDAALRGVAPHGVPYSPWQLLEHLRLTQHDILDFCRNPDYKELDWPADYWPSDPAPATAAAWDESIDRFRQDRAALQDLASDTKLELTTRIPHGS